MCRGFQPFADNREALKAFAKFQAVTQRLSIDGTYNRLYDSRVFFGVALPDPIRNTATNANPPGQIRGCCLQQANRFDEV